MILETKRLSLRPFKKEDKADFLEYALDKKHVKFDIFAIANKKEIEELFASYISNESYLAIVLNNKVIGHVYVFGCGLSIYEIGYILNYKYRQQGLAKEAVGSVGEYLFKNGTKKVFAKIHKDNQESIRFIESLNFVKEDSFNNDVVYVRYNPNLKDLYHFYNQIKEDLKPIDSAFFFLKNIYQLYDLLMECYSVETCAPRLRDNYPSSHKTLGQCSITAFLVQDIYGGEVYGVPLEDGNFHCFNKVGDSIFDLTSEQFDHQLEYTLKYKQSREVHFKKKEKEERYKLLKERLLQKKI